MHLLFVHQAFPAQFGQLALELARRYGWRCTCIFGHLSACPTPSPEMLDRLELIQVPAPPGSPPDSQVPWPQKYGRYLERCRDVFEVVRSRPELRPDLVVGHAGLGPALFLPEVLSCPRIDYCEYYFATAGADLTYRIDLPPAEPAPFFPRCINAATLMSLAAADYGYSPTAWQRDSFPARFHGKMAVHFDGIDTADLYRPREVARTVAGRPVPPGTRIVTFVSRGLESVRGFDLFMRVADRIARARPDVLFVVVGREETHYGWDIHHTGNESFKQWVLARGDYDLSRFIFCEHLDPPPLADLLCLSDLHLYLTVPFVLSWSLLNAMACGCTVLASDVAPVREVIEHERTGLLTPLFDIDRMTEIALRILDDPAQYRPLGQAARRLMEERYSLETAVPELKEYFERCANRSA